MSSFILPPPPSGAASSQGRSDIVSRLSPAEARSLHDLAKGQVPVDLQFDDLPLIVAQPGQRGDDPFRRLDRLRLFTRRLVEKHFSRQCLSQPARGPAAGAIASPRCEPSRTRKPRCSRPWPGSSAFAPGGQTSLATRHRHRTENPVGRPGSGARDRASVVQLGKSSRFTTRQPLGSLIHHGSTSVRPPGPTPPGRALNSRPFPTAILLETRYAERHFLVTGRNRSSWFRPLFDPRWLPTSRRE